MDGRGLRVRKRLKSESVMWQATKRNETWLESLLIGNVDFWEDYGNGTLRGYVADMNVQATRVAD